MIQILITGGTIDKHYDESGVLTFKDSKIPSILEQGRFNAALKYQQVMLKDSLDMDDGDRKKIANACESSSAMKIVITHGTDTRLKPRTISRIKNPLCLNKKLLCLWEQWFLKL